MTIPLQITYRGFAHSGALDALIHEEAEKLERFFPRITSAQILVERAFRHPRTGSPFHVRLDVALPGNVLCIDSEPTLRTTLLGREDGRVRKGAEISGAHKDAALAVRDAFRRAKRRLQDYARVTRGDVKRHEEPAASTITEQ